MGVQSRASESSITVAVATRDRVYLDSLSISMVRFGIVVRPLNPDSNEQPNALEDVEVLVLDTDSLTGRDLERAEDLRRERPLVEVLAIAGDSPVADAVRALRAGAFTVLQHPVADATLAQALTAAGRRHRRAKARLTALNGAGAAPTQSGRPEAPSRECDTRGKGRS